MQRQEILNELFVAFEKLRKNITPKGPHLPADLPSPAQLRVMFIVSQDHDGQGVSTKQIAEELEISSSAATQLIDGLVVAEYLTRRESAEDRRKTVIKLSAKAQGQFELMKASLIQAFAVKTKNLSDVELEQLLQLLNKINN